MGIEDVLVWAANTESGCHDAFLHSRMISIRVEAEKDETQVEAANAAFFSL